MRAGRPRMHNSLPARQSCHLRMHNAWTCRPTPSPQWFCSAAAMLHTDGITCQQRQDAGLHARLDYSARQATCPQCINRLVVVCQAVTLKQGAPSTTGQQSSPSSTGGKGPARSKTGKQKQRRTSSQPLSQSNLTMTSTQTQYKPAVKARTIQLPAAYHTVLCEHEAAAAASEWTADDGLEAADRQAIKQAEQVRLSRHAATRAQLPPPPTVITRLPAHFAPDVLDNAVLLLDKPLDWEADETARALRWALSGKRIGYVSGLEPGATGLMLLLFNKATGLTSILQNLGSTYTATIRLGVSTDTYDAAGRVTMLAPWQHVTDDEIQQVVAELKGKQVQVPPAFTAVKLRGKPVYDLTRATSKDELVPRPVTITHLSLERVEPGSQDLRLQVTFARTGYMRSLAHEVGQRLGCGAHLTSWRREAVGGFLVDNAWTLDVLLPVARKFVGRVKGKK